MSHHRNANESGEGLVPLRWELSPDEVHSPPEQGRFLLF
jgi:hypothetical protein